MSRTATTQQPLFAISRLCPGGEPGPLNRPFRSGNMIALYWIMKGNPVLTDGNNRIVLKQNVILCIRSEKQYRLQADPATDGYAVCFEPSLLYTEDWTGDVRYRSALYQLLENVSVLEMQSAHMEEIKTVCELLTIEQANAEAFNKQMVSQFLHILLVYLLRNTGVYQVLPAMHSRARLVHKFRALLEQQFKTKKQVAQYARELAITPNYLNEAIKSMTGHCAGYHIRQRLITEAIRKIRFQGAGMKEVAFSLGFSDMAHFSKFFKKETGQTFSDFRRQELSKELQAA